MLTRIPTGLSQWQSSWLNLGKHCHEERQTFFPFVISVYGMLGREALVILANLSRRMAAKMDEPIFHMQGWINRLITITVARSYSCMICGDWLPSPLHDQDPYWGPESGLGLAQQIALQNNFAFASAKYFSLHMWPLLTLLKCAPCGRSRVTNGDNLRRKTEETFWSKNQGYTTYKSGIGRKSNSNGKAKSEQHRI